MTQDIGDASARAKPGMPRHVGPSPWPRRLWRHLYWWREDRRVRQHYAGIRELVFFGGHGIGDELLLSAPLHELRRRGGTGLGVMTDRRELFLNSPDVDAIRPVAHRDVAFVARVGIRASHAAYIDEQQPPDIDVPPPRHIIAEMCRRCGVTGEIELRPWLWLTAAELDAARRWSGCIAIQASRASASLPLANKQWFIERFQAVADALAPSHRVVQVGLPEDPPLRGVEDLRGRTSLRQTAAVLASARALVGLVGLPMHLARAIDCPGVIVYGGRERPDQSGYGCNENLFSPVPCAPCWRWNSCDYERRCMSDITPRDVLVALERLLSRPRAPLAVERVSVP